MGFENPTFACLELDYEDADQDSTGEALKQAQQTLTYYELDLGMLFTGLEYSLCSQVMYIRKIKAVFIVRFKPVYPNHFLQQKMIRKTDS